MQLKHTASLREYQIKFEQIYSRIIDIPQQDWWAHSAFIDGLKSALCIDVESLLSRDLFDTISWVRLFTLPNYTASSSGLNVVAIL